MITRGDKATVRYVPFSALNAYGDCNVPEKCSDGSFNASSTKNKLRFSSDLWDGSADGEVTNKDAQFVLVAYTESPGTGVVDLPETAAKAADVNGDGKVGVDDAQNILIYYTENTIAGNPVTWEDIIAQP